MFISLLVALAVCNCEVISQESCIAHYTEFEEGTFKNYTENRHKLYKTFYPPNGRLPYSVIVNYQSALPNGTIKNILYTNVSGYVSKDWVWLSSPVFFFIRPEYVNRITLFTLNYFRPWETPKITLTVPTPCPRDTFQFLLEMTASLQDYALGDTIQKTHPGYVVVQSIEEHSFQRLPLDTKISKSDSGSAYYYPLIVLVVGGIFQSILIFMIAIIKMKRHLKEYAEKSYAYQYDHYGLMCGSTIVGLLLIIVVTYVHISTARIVFPQGQDKVPYAVYVSAIGIYILPGILIGIYFACKIKSPAIPNVFLIPMSLFCCCNIQRGKIVIFGAGIFVTVISMQCVSVTMLLILFAILTEPFAVVTNTLVLILFVFCLVNLLAVVFTISAYLFTPSALKSRDGRTSIIAHQAFVMVPLLVMICCYCTVVASGGYSINIDTKQGSIRSVFGTLAVPVILGGVTFGLKKMMGKTLEKEAKYLDVAEKGELSHRHRITMLSVDSQALTP